jgi:Vps16, N-terminal region
MHDKILKDYIVIHDNMGNLVNKIKIDRVVVGMGFLDDQCLLIVLSKGQYLTCNPFTGHTRFYSITPENEFDSDPILAVQIFGSSFVYMTKSHNFYLIENIRSYVKSKIFTPSE